MREEIEAAALFITRLVNKNLSQSGSIASSIHSHSSSSSSASSSSSESPPDLDEQNASTAQPSTTANTSSSSTTTLVGATTNNNNTTSSSLTNSIANSSSTNNTSNGCNSGSTNSIANDQDKAEQFRQCLEEALYERFHNHWFPDQPTKGQAYRCIRLNEWDRHDTTLQKACSQCGIDYKDLQLPVELTLWVDPDEVTCRFGENKGSHCLVAKFKDGELKDNNFNIDINNIDIEIFHQTAAERTRQQSLHGSPEYSNSNFYAKHLHNQRLNGNMNSNINNHQHQQHHHQQQQQQQHNSYHFLQNGNHHHQSPQHHNHHHQAPQQQTPPHQQHRANLGKAPMIPAYHHNYQNGCDTNGNPIYYYF